MLNVRLIVNWSFKQIWVGGKFCWLIPCQANFSQSLLQQGQRISMRVNFYLHGRSVVHHLDSLHRRHRNFPQYATGHYYRLSSSGYFYVLWLSSALLSHTQQELAPQTYNYCNYVSHIWVTIIAIYKTNSLTSTIRSCQTSCVKICIVIVFNNH